ncbi:MAG: NHL repeat-containing protein [Thermodesulfobacteriota bacterium]
MRTFPIRMLPLAAVLLLGLAASSQAGTLAGDYPRLASIRTGKITAMALDGAEQLCLLEAGGSRLLVTSRQGRVQASLAGLADPISLAADRQGRWYVGSAETGSVEVLGPTLRQPFALGQGAGEFGRPSAIAVSRAGTVYVADSKEQQIKVFDPAGRRLFAFGSPGSGNGSFHFPTALAIDEAAGEVVVTDLPIITSPRGPHEGARVQFFTLDGGYRRSFGTYGTGAGLLMKPLGVAVDAAGRVLVSDAQQGVVQVFDRQGAFIGTLYDPEHPLRTPLAVAVGPASGQLFVASLNSGTVEVYGPSPEPIVHVLASAGGRVTPSGDIPVPFGQDLSLTLAPDPGHHVTQLLVDGSDAGARTAYTLAAVTADHTVEARFGRDSFAIAASAAAGGRIAPAGQVPALFGDSPVFAITADPGFEIADLLVDGISVGATGTYTFTRVTASHTIRALFRPVAVTRTFEVAVAVAGAGVVEASGIRCPGDCTETCAGGTELVLVAAAAPEQVFAGWGGDCAGTGLECRLTADSPKTVTARFVPAADLDTFEAEGPSSLPWLTGGDSPWTRQAVASHSGTMAMAAPTLAPGQMSFLEVPLATTTAGEVTFWSRIVAEPGMSALRFLVDNVELGRWSAGQDWTDAGFNIPAGRHVFRWEYLQAEGQGFDGLWLDDVIFPAHLPPAWPLPDLKVNHGDGPLLLGAGGQALVSVAVAAGPQAGSPSTGYLALKGGKRLFFLDGATGLWQLRPAALAAAPLAEDSFTHTRVADLGGLPAGLYTLYYVTDVAPPGAASHLIAADQAVIQVRRR